MSVKFEHLVTDRNQNILPVVNRLTALSPILAIAFPKVWVDDHRFEFDGPALLASREFENLMAERWIAIQIAAVTVADARKLVSTIQSGLLAWR